MNVLRDIALMVMGSIITVSLIVIITVLMIDRDKEKRR